ncbi:MAG TPA: ribosome small subunit-dependent GTPase A [Thermotoga sp.]|nr:ribosome small subunit-dependent GTPase A [Thermotoga sp.]
MRKFGTVVSFHSNFVMVEDEETQKRILCKLRGKFRLQGLKIFVGDKVEYTQDGTNSGVIENVLHRKNLLPKPKIANVDQVILVTSLKKPEVSTFILDRFLVLSEKSELPVIIVFNKIDLYEEKEWRRLSELEKIYSKYYKTLRTSVVTGEGLEELKEIFKGKISTMAGVSGVGKSSLLNAINPGLKLKVSEVSEKLGRGRHTTTTIQLLKFDFGGYVADTPGFANLDISNIEPEDLKEFFIEFRDYEGMCAFSDCNHISEPGCAVIKAVENGEIPKSRYESYVLMFKELEEMKKGGKKKWSK